VQNWRADVVAITKSDGSPLQYVVYSPYGEPVTHAAADVDLDGDVDSSDQAAWANGAVNNSFAYAAMEDLNHDGTDTAADDALFDESYKDNLGLSGRGRLSAAKLDNRKGYAGYEHDESLTMYHVRHRVCRADLGRWMTRDPLGYVDGMGLYEYGHAQQERTLSFDLEQFELKRANGDWRTFPVFPLVWPLDPGFPSYPKDDLTGPTGCDGIDSCQDLRPRPGYTPVSNGCTHSPDNPNGYRFRPCCDAHDLGYGTCDQTTRSLTDLQFCVCLTSACLREPRLSRRLNCLQFAHTYCVAVKVFGAIFYCPSKRAACVCCDNNQTSGCAGGV